MPRPSGRRLVVASGLGQVEQSVECDGGIAARCVDEGAGRNRLAVLLDANLLDDPPSPLPAIATQRLYVGGGAGLSASQEKAATSQFGCVPLLLSEDYLAPALDCLKPVTPDLPSS